MTSKPVKTIPSSFSKGSLWRKWDLHIHSPLTILNNQYPKLADGTPDWDAFITKLESLDVAAIAITDYFTIDGYKKVKEYKEQGRLQKIHTILPNIEFRLNNVLSSRKDGQQPRRLNYHVIFSDDVSPQDIEEHFLHDIDFFYEGNPQGEDDKRKLKVSNLEALGKKLKEQHQSFKKSGLSSLVVGAMQAVVNHEEISRRLQGARFKGKYLLVFPEEHSNLIGWDGQDHHTRKALLQKSDMVFSAAEKTREWCLGKPPYMDGTEKFLEEFKTLKPCIHGSDAHKLDEIGHPCSLRGSEGHTCQLDGAGCSLRYCWIKADPTFEGLKQLLYEPDERVRIQQQNPTLPRSNFTLERIQIERVKVNDDLSVQGTDMELNPNLVAVTGGKGSGKTAFLDLIANCYTDRCNTKDENSFVRRVVDECPGITTSLSFKDGTKFSKNLKDNHFFENSELVYIAQGELQSYIGDRSDIDDYIRSLIFESPQIRDTVLSFEFAELIEQVGQVERDIADKNRIVAELEKQTSKDVAQALALEKKQKDAELKDIETRIAEYEKAQSVERVQLAQQKQKSLAELKARKDDLVSLRDLIVDTLAFLGEDLVSFNDGLAKINELLTKLKITEHLESFSYPQKGILETRLAQIKPEITNIVQNIETAQKELEKLEAGVQDHAKSLDKKRELTKALGDVAAREQLLAKKQQGLEAAIKDRKALLTRLVETILAQRKKYEDIISTFSSKKAEVLSDLTFIARVQFDAEKFLNFAEEVLDNRRVTTRGTSENPSAFSKLLQLTDKVTNGDETAIDSFVAEIENLNAAYKSKLKAAQTISIQDFYSCLYGNYLSVTPVVKYKNIQLSRLSLGQKATVLIKIHLAQGYKPIIIDSHDDHLDNEFIMEELVKAIRQAKQYRQVILASNNGNVVVNSDAEQIILANIKGGEISYVSGSLENPAIRDRAVKVLEGGSEAFRQRQKKYRLHL